MLLIPRMTSSPATEQVPNRATGKTNFMMIHIIRKSADFRDVRKQNHAPAVVRRVVHPLEKLPSIETESQPDIGYGTESSEAYRCALLTARSTQDMVGCFTGNPKWVPVQGSS